MQPYYLATNKLLNPELDKAPPKHKPRQAKQMDVSWNVSLLKHRDPPTEVIYPANPPCWLVDNGMQLNLLLIRVLMCVIKYIAMSQLENTGAIHHFNWYPPRATWAHHIPSVFPKWSLLVERRSESGIFLLERTHWLYGVCVCMCTCVCTLLDCIYLDLCVLWAMGRWRTAVWLLIINHTSPMTPVLSVYWMVMRWRMQMQSAPCIWLKQSHLISYSWVQLGNMDVSDSGLIKWS